ncbi:hypothetical protein EVAR_102461_1 [Eumeta japonica]|uniref:Uncharacterized protein n=1 Tax=Eumeta variegata TaxID=151549 RepID=A0A4C1ZUS2_EUMVA|nr:hypothetical protein EVAR_102461_1 [Eumeta japonica]
MPPWTELSRPIYAEHCTPAKRSMRSVGTTLSHSLCISGLPAVELALRAHVVPQWAHFSDASLQKRLSVRSPNTPDGTRGHFWHAFCSTPLPSPDSIETVGDVLILGPQGLDDVLVRIDLEDVPDDDRRQLFTFRDFKISPRILSRSSIFRASSAEEQLITTFDSRLSLAGPHTHPLASTLRAA